MVAFAQIREVSVTRKWSKDVSSKRQENSHLLSAEKENEYFLLIGRVAPLIWLANLQ